MTNRAICVNINDVASKKFSETKQQIKTYLLSIKHYKNQELTMNYQKETQFFHDLSHYAQSR